MSGGPDSGTDPQPGPAAYAGPEAPGDQPTDATTQLPAFGPTPGADPNPWASSQNVSQNAWQSQSGGQPQMGHAPGQTGYPQQGHTGETPVVGSPYGQPGGPVPGAPVPGGPAGSGKSNLGWIFLIVGVVLVVVLAAAGWWLTYGGNEDEFPVGSCVKPGPDKSAVAASCNESGAFKVVKKVDKEEQCSAPDATVALKDGDTLVGVLCLKRVG